jgi:hypothetical protein
VRRRVLLAKHPEQRVGADGKGQSRREARAGFAARWKSSSRRVRRAATAAPSTRRSSKV